MEPVRQAWVQTFGEAVLWFGQVEWFTHHVIADYSSDDIHGAVAEMNFAARAHLAQAILASRLQAHPAVLQLSGEVFSEARALAKRRNALVHNPLEINVQFRAGTPGLAVLSQIVSAKGSPHFEVIPLEQARDFVTQIEALNERMGYLFNHLRQLLGPAG